MLIVGLGNPGTAYAKNRHNIGFMVIDELILRFNAQKVSSSSFNGELFKFQNHFLLKPLTYMNLSGDCISSVKKFYKIKDVVVIHDDLDLPFGSVRFKIGGGDGGHNGLKSTDKMIGKEYIRIRMGIGRPKYKGEVSSYVLGDFVADEQKYLGMWISHVCDGVEFLLSHSLENTSSKYTIKQISLK